MLVLQFFYFFFFILGTYLTLVSFNWFWSWVGMELNLFFFLPLVMNYSLSISDSSFEIKFFLVQSLGSVSLFMSMVFFFFDYNFFHFIAILGYVFKIGLYPVIMIFFSLCMDLSWKVLWVFSVWYKLSSLYFFYMFHVGSDTIYMFLFILSSIFGLFYMFVSNNLKLLVLGFSFIQLLYVYFLIYCGSDFFVYYIIYSYVSYSVILSLDMSNSLVSFDLGLISYMFWPVIFSFMSYMGVPPFLGFYLKMILFESLMNMYLFIFVLFIMVLSIYSYIRFISVFSMNFFFGFGFCLNLSFMSLLEFFLSFLSLYILFN
uniref:NADH dehydrogenase subunit 2 n=1 Tax=Parasacculina shiinoi TaxID=2836419 RepID=UPI002551ED0E|nr:NADH dehydrogenase subunit 2 [Parasacculina shiinoi]WGU20875.1 NADH dehydrogenase subunit 2 [Parasacculina shiinoi]